MIERRPAFFALLLALIAVCGSTFGGALPEEKPDRILFIGNSLTSWNDLPFVVEVIARLTGARIECDAVTYPDFSLEDHWNAGTPSRIRQGHWKYVVLQQGPSSLPSSRKNLREWTRKFATEIRSAGAEPALYMVWPDRSRLKFLRDVQESYRLANDDAGGVLLPAGEIWEKAWAVDPKLALYGPDSFHPSPLGTLAVALTIVKALTGRVPETLPASLKLRNGRDHKVDPADAAVVLAVVAAFPS